MGMSQRGLVSAALLIVVLGLAPSTPVHGNWLSRLAGEAGEAGGRVGGRAAREAAQGLEGVARHVQKLPPLAKGEAVLGAHVGHEGHWTFVNRAGERFTAGTPEELQRVTRTLLPEADQGGRLHFVVSQDTAFGRANHLKDLPEGARLELLSGKQRLPLVRQTAADGSVRLIAVLKPHITVALTSWAAFAEMVHVMGRPLDARRLRIISLEPGGPQTLKPRGVGDAAGRPLPEAIDPFKLAAAFSSMKGQTVLVSGRVEGTYLAFKPASGGEQTMLMSDLRVAAAAHDVDLVIVQSARAEQPGARNWLYQQVAVSGLDKAKAPSTVGDLLDAVAERRGRMVATVAHAGPDRVTTKLEPAATPSPVSTDVLTGWFDEVVQNVVGNVVTSAIELDTTSAARQKELEARIVPGIPSDIQIGYIMALVAGLMGLGTARGWWNRVWRPEVGAEYSSAVGYWAARAVRLIVFVLLFLPLVGGPALLVSLLGQVLGLLLLPVRALQWLFGLFRRTAG